MPGPSCDRCGKFHRTEDCEWLKMVWPKMQRNNCMMDVTNSQEKMEENSSVPSESNVAKNSPKMQRNNCMMDVTDSPLEEVKMEEQSSVASDSNVNSSTKQRKPQSTCQLCGKLYRDKQHHMTAYHKGFVKEPLPLKVQCTICGKYVSRSTISNHKKIHAASNNVECDICHFKTKTKRNLRQHMNRHTKATNKEEFQRLLKQHSAHSDILKDCNEKIVALENDLELAKRLKHDSVRKLQEELSVARKEHDESVIKLTHQINGFETIENDLKNLLERKTIEYETKINNIKKDARMIITAHSNSMSEKMRYDMANATKRLQDQMQLINDVRREKTEALSAVNLKLQEAMTKCSQLESDNDILIRQKEDAELQIKEQLKIIENVTLENQKLKAQLQRLDNIDFWEDTTKPLKNES